MASPWSLSGALKGMFARKTIDDETWDDLEDALISADFGTDITDSIVKELRANVQKYRTTDPEDLRRMLRESLEERLARLDAPALGRLHERGYLQAIFMVIASLAHFRDLIERAGRQDADSR